MRDTGRVNPMWGASLGFGKDRTFNNHRKQKHYFSHGDRVVQIKDGESGVFCWESCPMNGHNDSAGSWGFTLDNGERIYLTGYVADTFPWRIPNRFQPAPL